MMYIHKRLLVALVLFFCSWSLAPRAEAIPAFPGAEGAGANAIGGRGGDLYFVTNTNNTGAGSLRNGITTATGPRTILFKVSGNIDLSSTLAINKPYLTIAGQTAPGDGITIRKFTTSVQDTHDVIVRFIRCRPGDLVSSFEDDSFHVVHGSNVVVDHVSSSWSVDECLSVTHSTNVTIQWCMITESLKNSQHDKGAHGYGSLLRYGAGELTYHHNLYEHHDSRNPRLGDRIKLDFVNNVLYNWGGRAGYSGGNGATEDTKDNPGGVFTNHLNYVSNYLIAGVSSSTPNTAFASGATNTVIYQSGNRIDPNKNAVLDGTDTGAGMFSGYPYTVAATRYPIPAIAADSAANAYQRVLAFVGASFVRDSVDARLIGNVRNHTGRIVDAVGPGDQATDYVTNNINGMNLVFVRGWPTPNSLPAPVDSDNDGIPTYFESALGWNPSTANNNHTNSDGYTDLEWYLNWLADPHATGGADQSIGTNLRQLTGGNTNLTFTVADGTNGSVALSGDGFTAQFQPTANFKGRASFLFSATNSTDGGGFGPVTVAVLITNVLPAITQQPAGITNNAGETIMFSVIASGADLGYRWLKGSQTLTNGNNVSGASSTMLTLTNIVSGDSADYTVVITNSVGSVTSSVAALLVIGNTPPALDPISDYEIIAGATLTFTNIATDTDVPAQTVMFSLLNAPAEASVNSSNGVFVWRPAVAEGGSSNFMAVVATDNGSPNLGTTQSFSIVVNTPAIPQVQPASVVDGQFRLTINGDAGPDYTVLVSTNLTDWSSLFTTNSPSLPFTWTDEAAGSFNQRFYQIQLSP